MGLLELQVRALQTAAVRQGSVVYGEDALVAKALQVAHLTFQTLDILRYAK